MVRRKQDTPRQFVRKPEKRRIALTSVPIPPKTPKPKKTPKKYYYYSTVSPPQRLFTNPEIIGDWKDFDDPNVDVSEVVKDQPAAGVWFNIMKNLEKKYSSKKKRKTKSKRRKTKKKTGGVTKRRSNAEKKAYQAKLRAMTKASKAEKKTYQAKLRAMTKAISKRKPRKGKKAEMINPYKEPSVYQWVSTFPGVNTAIKMTKQTTLTSLIKKLPRANEKLFKVLNM